MPQFCDNLAMALVPFVRDEVPGIKIDDLTGLCLIFEKWFRIVHSRDVFHVSEVIDRLWTRGSGIDVDLLGDPYLYELAVLLASEEPTLDIKKAELRDSLLNRHKARPCLFHTGSAFAVASTVAERFRNYFQKFRFLKRHPARYMSVRTKIESHEKKNVLIV